MNRIAFIKKITENNLFIFSPLTKIETGETYFCFRQGIKLI